MITFRDKNEKTDRVIKAMHDLTTLTNEIERRELEAMAFKKKRDAVLDEIAKEFGIERSNFTDTHVRDVAVQYIGNRVVQGCKLGSWD